MSNIYKLVKLKLQQCELNIYRLVKLKLQQCELNIYRLVKLKLQQCELNIYKLVKLKLQQCESNIYRKKEIYNIGVLRVNIEFMWRGLESGERQALESLSIRFVPSHINSIFTVNAPILYLSCNKLQKKMLFHLIIKKKDNGNPIDTSIVVPVRDVAYIAL